MTYTPKAQNASIFTFKNILIAILGIIIIYLLTCNNSVEKKPVVIKGEEVIKEINLVEKERKHIEDSFNLIIQKAYQLNDDNYTAYIETININSELFRENKLLRQKVPDTCKPIVAAWIERERQLKVASDNKDAAAKKTITGLQGTLWEQQRFLYAKDSLYAKMRSVADTCAKALVKLEKYVKQVDPKRKILVSVSGMGMYGGKLNPAVGGGLVYQTKKGLQIDGKVYTNKIVTVGLSFPLIKF